MTFASPIEGKRYYLRLLCNIRGATSFKDLLTVNGFQSDSFKMACEPRAHDDYVDACMQEAVDVQMSYALRRLFVKLIFFIENINPLALWNRFYSHMFEDYNHIHPNRPHHVARLTSLMLSNIWKLWGSVCVIIKFLS
ncbi:LOW QUALITY PROTEIN: hypothetical protein V2J09_006415 [Rumex salicifolius]